MSPSSVFRILCWSFLGGTATGLFFDMSLGTALLIAACLVVAGSVAVSSLNHIPFRSAFIFLVGALCFGLGWLLASGAVRQWKTLPESGGTVREAVVVRDPVVKENRVDVMMRAVQCETMCPKEFVLVSFPPFSDMHLSDRVALSCQLDRPQIFSPDFDYPMYLAKERIGFVCRYPRDWLVIGREGRSLQGVLSKFRGWLEKGNARSVPEPEAGLLAGLVLGGDARLPESTREAFSKTGLSHIVAVSGSNVTLVAAVLMGALILFGLWRQKAYWASLVGVVLFTLLVGMPSSAMRAMIMSGVALSAMRIGRKADPQNAVLIAACGMLLFNPLLLRYDIGFQLSFLATIGILLVSPFLLVSFRFGDIVAMTVAAELFVLPILLMNFHALPVFSLLANILVLPIVPFAMFFGFLGMIIGAIIPAIASVIGFPGFLFARYILFIVEYIAALPFASMSIPSFGVWHAVCFYGVILILLLAFKKRRALFPNIFSARL